MRQLIVKCASAPLVWSFLDATVGNLSRSFRRLENYKRRQEDADEDKSPVRKKFKALFLELIVRHGPFQGMKYPRLASIGSTLYPKLLGSYEKELDEVLSFLTKQPYEVIVDIGCAEGYYAVGLGRACPSARVHAFDTNEEALDACQQLADLNNVTIQKGGFCDENTLLNLDLGAKALIFADCEGYERELFTTKVAEGLRAHDILIELHDFMHLGIRPQLLAILEKTHNCELIQSVDDIQKAYEYEFPELEGMSLAERREILHEGRPQIMWWLFARAK